MHNPKLRILGCDTFYPFFLHWFELWRELSLSSEWNQPIPHKLADRAIFWCRSQEPVFFFVSPQFSVDWFQIGRWPLRVSSPTALWSCILSLVAVGVDLATNRKDHGWGRFSRRLCSSVSRVRGQSAVLPADSPGIGIRPVQNQVFSTLADSPGFQCGQSATPVQPSPELFSLGEFSEI
jgi:hypothetical protein